VQSPATSQAAGLEHPVKTFGEIAGTWVTSDDLDPFYELTIRADGDFELVIDRGKRGRCVTHATLVQAKPRCRPGRHRTRAAACALLP